MQVSHVCAIDAGEEMGLARFYNRELYQAVLVRSYQAPPSEFLGVFDHCVIEFPQIRVRGGGKGDPNQIVKLAGRTCGWAGRYIEAPDPELVFPVTWKGDVRKEITERRVKKILSAAELARVPTYAESYMSNVWDSIGLGLWKVGRYT